MPPPALGPTKVRIGGMHDSTREHPTKGGTSGPLMLHCPMKERECLQLCLWSCRIYYKALFPRWSHSAATFHCMLFAAQLSGRAPRICNNTCGTCLLADLCHPGCACATCCPLWPSRGLDRPDSHPPPNTALHRAATFCTGRLGTQGPEAGRSPLWVLQSMLASWQGDRPLINHAVMVLVVVPPKIVIFHRQAVYRRGRNMLSCLMVGPRTHRVLNMASAAQLTQF